VKRFAVLLALLAMVAAALGPGREYTLLATWWLTNTQPPVAVLSAPPSGAMRGAAEIRVETLPTGRVEIVGADIDGRELAPSANLRVDTSGLPDGEHTLTVRVQDRSLRRNSGGASVKLVSDNTPPRIEIGTPSGKLTQGHTAVLYFRSNEPAEIDAKLNGQPILLHATGAEHWAVVGIDADEKPGPREVSVSGRDRVGNEGRAEGSVTIQPYEFTRDSLVVPQTLLPLLEASVRAREEEQLKQLYRPSGSPPRWRGPFKLPVIGPISTEFGEVRSYNGGPFQGHHGGTDFQVASGTPVQAPANGTVVFREEVRLRGKVIVLDHGAGVYTLYAHLSEWLAEVGLEVTQGQPIAKVGSTGLSTGPHLHWELWVNGVSVDPVEWTEREVP
jgi:murein DD-endopeptidase MepM/ murein hydrolase activator NlpD